MEDVVTPGPAVQRDPAVQPGTQPNRTHCVMLFSVLHPRCGWSFYLVQSKQLSLDGSLLRLPSKMGGERFALSPDVGCVM